MSTAPATARAPAKQFGLLHVFALVSGASVLLGIGTWSPVLAIVLAFFLCLIGVSAALHRIGKLSVAEILVLFGIAGVIVALLLPAVGSRPRGHSRRSQSSNNLKNIVLALHNYHEQHGSFPPQYVVDAQGQPLYSWRVLILPYLEEQRRYEDFHLDEPWNSPHNLTLLHPAPPVFHSPSAVNPKGKFANYVGISGIDMPWQGEKSLDFRDLKDGTSNTLLLVEWKESDVEWSEPRDLPLKDARAFWYPPAQTKAGEETGSQKGFNVGYGDGHVNWLKPSQLTAPQLRSLLTPAGGEPPVKLP